MHDSNDTDRGERTASRRTVLRAAGTAALAAGAVPAVAQTDEDGESGDGSTTPVAPLVVNDFAGGWPGTNALGNYAAAGDLANGAGEVVDGRLRLEYDGVGWFMSNVRRDLSAYDRLVLTVAGDEGGEGEGIQLEVGGVEGTLADLAGDAVGTNPAPVAVDLAEAGVDRSSVDAIDMGFFEASGAVEIGAIRFESAGDDGPAPIDGTVPGDPDGDGDREDINGNGRLDYQDVVSYFEHMDEPEMTDHARYYDYNDNGRIDYTDLVDLFREVA